MTAKYSIIVPTYNRSHFVERLLRYFKAAGVTCPIHIVDGSTDEHVAANADVIDSYKRNDLDARHFVPNDNYVESIDDCQFGYAPRIAALFQSGAIDTPLVHLCQDDSFVSAEFLEDAAILLECNSEFSAVCGHIWVVYLDLKRADESAYGKMARYRLIENNHARHEARSAQRIVANLVENPGMLWTMHRRETIEIWGNAAREVSQRLQKRPAHGPHLGRAEEFAFDFIQQTAASMISLSRGKLGFVPRMALGHHVHAGNWGLKLRGDVDMGEVIDSPFWSEISGGFKRASATVLADCGEMTQAEADYIANVFVHSIVARRFISVANQRVADLSLNLNLRSDSSLRAGLKRVPGLQPAVKWLRAWRERSNELKLDQKMGEELKMSGGALMQRVIEEI